MSDEQRNEETEVEAHTTGKLSWPKPSANSEPSDEAGADDEVEAHTIGKVSYPKGS